MIKNLFKKKEEIDLNKKYIDTKRNEIQMKKEELRGEMDRWGKRQKQRKNFP